MAKSRKKKLNKEMRSQIKGILIIALGLFSYFGLVETAQTGGVGLFLNSLLRTVAGDAALVIPFFIAIIGIRIILPRERHTLKVRLAGLLILFILYTVWIHLDLMSSQLSIIAKERFLQDSFLIGLNRQGGGIVGAAFAVLFYFFLGFTGSRILLGALAIIALLLVLNISLKKFFNAVFTLLNHIIEFLKSFILYTATLAGKLTVALQKRKHKTLLRREAEELSSEREETPQDNMADETLSQSGPVIIDGRTKSSVTDNDNVPAATENYQQERQSFQLEQQSEVGGKEDEKFKSSIIKTGKSSAEYKLPPLVLLNKHSTSGEQNYRKNSSERAKLLENTLQSFGVKARVIHVQSGPTVTRFEVQPEAGVKVSKIISLSDDLALNLAAPLVRIEAPIPGKAALGIEVPNKVVSLVYLREVIEENSYKQSNSPLTVALGKDITGVPVIADLTKMPHLLIAGATGAGKSVCLNTLINSILYKAGPDQIRFMMIDPKVVELSVYNGIPHLLMPVLTDPRKASLALRNMVREMGRRYDLFASMGVRDIGAYNELITEEKLEKLPFIVVLIDELADLMLVSPGEVEDAIARLAQMSRAAGIHLIVATQRPSVDVLTGIIKANITSRIAFTVSSQFDSRTILDMAGAEKLLGRGDMLFYPVGAVKPFRVQGAYVSEAEVKRVTDFIKEQGIVDYEKSSSFLDVHEESKEEEADTLFGEAVDLVVRTGQASISLLQRRFRIGYTRAARLIDDLERRGIVGSFEGSKPREVLVTQEQAAKICEDFNSKGK